LHACREPGLDWRVRRHAHRRADRAESVESVAMTKLVALSLIVLLAPMNRRVSTYSRFKFVSSQS
jgi:hypothetical protein